LTITTTSPALFALALIARELMLRLSADPAPLRLGRRCTISTRPPPSPAFAFHAPARHGRAAAVGWVPDGLALAWWGLVLYWIAGFFYVVR
jgi:cardiolipin synthase